MRQLRLWWAMLLQARTRQCRSKKKLTRPGSRITSLQAADGRRLGFWSPSKTEINFLDRLTLMKVQVRTVSTMGTSRRMSAG
jgi:hypothetical protein